MFQHNGQRTSPWEGHGSSIHVAPVQALAHLLQLMFDKWHAALPKFTVTCNKNSCWIIPLSCKQDEMQLLITQQLVCDFVSFLIRSIHVCRQQLVSCGQGLSIFLSCTEIHQVKTQVTCVTLQFHLYHSVLSFFLLSLYRKLILHSLSFFKV